MKRSYYEKTGIQAERNLLVTAGRTDLVTYSAQRRRGHILTCINSFLG